ncbi:MAG: LpxI family protein [Desulfovibrionaceae bacterium]
MVIGLIAGGRQFPVLVAKGAREAGHTVVAAAFTGHSNMDVAAYADEFRELKLGKLNQLIQYFKQHGVQEVVMAGSIDKPRIMDVRHLDMRAIKLVFKRKDKGDATILGALAAEFESEGMHVRPPHELVPGLLTPAGLLTRRQPTEREWEDLRFAFAMAKELGRLDIGQCVVVREGIVAAVEALEGTDETIARGCRFGGAECVVVKVFKPCQEERADLPSAGADTIRALAAGKATCLGLEAGKSLLFDREAAVKAADAAGISIVGLTPEDTAAGPGRTGRA